MLDNATSGSSRTHNFPSTVPLSPLTLHPLSQLVARNVCTLPLYRSRTSIALMHSLGHPQASIPTHNPPTCYLTARRSFGAERANFSRSLRLGVVLVALRTSLCARTRFAYVLMDHLCVAINTSDTLAALSVGREISNSAVSPCSARVPATLRVCLCVCVLVQCVSVNVCEHCEQSEAARLHSTVCAYVCVCTVATRVAGGRSRWSQHIHNRKRAIQHKHQLSPAVVRSSIVHVHVQAPSIVKYV